jgi:hypothetical protein
MQLMGRVREGMAARPHDRERRRRVMRLGVQVRVRPRSASARQGWMMPMFVAATGGPRATTSGNISPSNAVGQQRVVPMVLLREMGGCCRRGVVLGCLLMVRGVRVVRMRGMVGG